jgi:hypothetical protein
VDFCECLEYRGVPTRMTKIAKVHTSVVLISEAKASHSELSVIPCRKRMPYVSMH